MRNAGGKPHTTLGVLATPLVTMYKLYCRVKQLKVRAEDPSRKIDIAAIHRILTEKLFVVCNEYY